jgi:hypothetical protein
MAASHKAGADRARFFAAFGPSSLFPDSARAEIAFCGRSNVGKSSLLNALTGVKGLARTSKTPGRTREIHFYEEGTDRFLVDLPGLRIRQGLPVGAGGLAGAGRGIFRARRPHRADDPARGLPSPPFESDLGSGRRWPPAGSRTWSSSRRRTGPACPSAPGPEPRRAVLHRRLGGDPDLREDGGRVGGAVAADRGRRGRAKKRIARTLEVR